MRGDGVVTIRFRAMRERPMDKSRGIAFLFDNNCKLSRHHYFAAGDLEAKSACSRFAFGHADLTLMTSA